jgi:hypothetical protein
MPPEMYRSLPLQSEYFQSADRLFVKAAQGAAAACPRTPDLLPMADRDTRVVGQNLSWSCSTRYFPELVLRITPDGIRCFG